MSDLSGELNPNPAALVESLRAFPYSAQSAIADLIDNSITANSRVIRIFARWDNGNPTVEIIDDGDGMNVNRLREALRFAGLGPSSPRDSSDLGRFGLGLKTASLSQCRRMTVTTVKDNCVANLGWDIDELRKSGGWTTAHSSDEIIQGQLVRLQGQSGTIVRWQKLDRLLGPNIENHSSDDLDFIFEKVSDHLEMVFHRFLQRLGKDGLPQLTIYINETKLSPWDPFLDSYPVKDQIKRIEDQNIDLPSGVSRVVGYVLPTEREAKADGALDLWESAGRKQWNQLQGFYVYRLDRLITHGGYLGLDRLPDEHTKLARIMIELDNNTDNDWLLDVTKSTVTPPVRAQRQLKQVARSVCSKASERYRSRVRSFCAKCNRRPCQCPKAPQLELVWKCPNLVDEIGKFTINVQHSVIKEFRNNLTSEVQQKFEQILRLISKTVPIAHFRGIPSIQEGDYLDRFDDRKESTDLIYKLICTAVSGRLSAGEPPSAIRQSLLWIEPFSDFPDLIDQAITNLTQN